MTAAGPVHIDSDAGQVRQQPSGRVIGGVVADPMDLQVISLGSTPGSAHPYEGRYPAGSLVHDGVWYYGTYCLLRDRSLSMNYPVLGPFVGFRVSRDMGKTWVDGGVCPQHNLFGEHTDRSSARPVKIGAPHFVDFGKNMEHSPDGYALS